jgi:predicted amidohydrolase YtcJ
VTAADLIVDAAAVHTMAGGAAPVTAPAIRDGVIAATAGPDQRADVIAAWRGPSTVMLDEPGLVVLPALARASAGYAARGLGTVRDASVSPQQWQAYRQAQAAGQLSVRCHAMIFSTPAVIALAGPGPAGTLVVEHGGLIGEHIARAVSLGVHVTVQQALLDGLAPAFLSAWGQDRTAAVFPWRELLDAGAWISAGTDHPIGPLDPLRALHGMTTRVTPAGVLGPAHAISRAEALRLYTVAGTEFLGVPSGGALVRGAPADLVAYPADPVTCADGELLSLSPAATVIGGQIAYRAS